MGTGDLRNQHSDLFLGSSNPTRRASFTNFLRDRHSGGMERDTGAVSSSRSPSPARSSSEFEFAPPTNEDDENPADELFYNGKMLPLEPVSRMAMVKDLNIMFRRGGSAPPSPYIDPVNAKPSTTQKSSSYPPRGRNSRRFRDFFGGGTKRCHSQNDDSQKSSSSSSSSSFLKSLFGKKSTPPVTRPVITGDAKKNVGIRKNRAVSLTGDFTRSAPSTPLHPRATVTSFVPVLHIGPGPVKVSKFFSGSSSKSIEVL